MARLPRLTLPGTVHHVTQRGNNGQIIAADAADKNFFLALLAESAQQCGVAVHAYVLTDTHVQLLATPESEEGLPRMMQAVGRRYVRYFNDRYGRSGTLWEGRFRSTPIQSERHLLACMVYLDLNPVRAGLVAEASQYAWSSHLHWIGRRVDRLLTPHARFWELGNTPFAREAAYAELVRTGLDKADEAKLTHALNRGWAFGDADFVAQIQKQTGHRVSPSMAGRPRQGTKTD
jgi:putative transposase